jgi:hypothetical protein
MEIETYGELCDNSNFEIVCEDEENCGFWIDGNPNSEDLTFKNWDEVKTELSKHFDGIVEISAI